MGAVQDFSECDTAKPLNSFDMAYFKSAWLKNMWEIPSEPGSALVRRIGRPAKVLQRRAQRRCFIWPVGKLGSFFRMAGQRTASAFSCSALRAAAETALCFAWSVGEIGFVFSSSRQQAAAP